MTLLAGCSQILGLSDGTDQGPCETAADCAPGYECRQAVCTSVCASDDCSSANAGGDDANAGGRDPNPGDGGAPTSNGGKTSGSAGASTAGKTSTSAAGTAGSSLGGLSGVGGRAPVDLPLGGTGGLPKFP